MRIGNTHLPELPPGCQWDPEELKVLDRANRLQLQLQISFSEALDRAQTEQEADLPTFLPQLPPGGQWDPRELRVLDRAQNFQRQNADLSFSEAVQLGARQVDQEDAQIQSERQAFNLRYLQR